MCGVEHDGLFDILPPSLVLSVLLFLLGLKNCHGVGSGFIDRKGREKDPFMGWLLAMLVFLVAFRKDAKWLLAV